MITEQEFDFFLESGDSLNTRYNRSSGLLYGGNRAGIHVFKDRRIHKPRGGCGLAFDMASDTLI